MGFFDWYERHITESMLVTAVILYLQIPHFVWAGDAYLQLGIITHKNPVLDFFLYGIDLIELIPITAITLAIISKLRHKFKYNL